MNYCRGGITLMNPYKPDFMKAVTQWQDVCRAEMFNKSMPNFVFMDFGGNDLIFRDFNSERFTNDYVAYIRSVQNMT